GRGPFLAEAAAVVDWVKAAPPADPAEPVLVAGEPERLHKAQRSRSGIGIDQATWAELLAAADAAGLGAARFAELAGAE
ncbi:MAG: Ldh family oxidoreductase, partial [Rhodospirillaceae bacterium]|nr:Ldh family oxidoreductase [Rhodospirillaceae bacterium]